MAAGLEAQGWQETRSHSGKWRRWAKWGRGAMYVKQFWEPAKGEAVSQLWFSELRFTDPEYPVVGPILEQVLLAGDSALAATKVDTEQLLCELMYFNGGSDGT